MSGIFGTKNAAQQPPISGLQLQTSSYGKPIPLVFGANRIAPNLIWYGDFFNITAQVGGGKGGLFSAGSQTQTNYYVALALALCEGPISGYGTVYSDKKQVTTASLLLSEFLGTYPQAPWSYLTTRHPAEAFPYNGVAYLATQFYALGTSAQLPNHNMEVFGLRYHSVSGLIADADPSLVVSDLLSNAKFGVPNFSTWLGSLTTCQNYALAAGLLISPVYESQRSARDIIDEIALMINCEVTNLSTGLTLVPRGDEAITGNGKTYTPPTAVWDLGDDDFLPSSSGGSKSPIRIVRKRPSDILNSVRLECLDRTKQYQPIPVEAKDQAAIDTYGLRQQGLKSAHLFCDPVAARASAQLQLQRQAVGNLYYFDLDLRFVFFEPMDIITLTHAAQGLSLVGVRIRTIQKKGPVLSFECEEYLAATGSAGTYSFQQGQGFAANYNVAPGNVNRPVVFEPTPDLNTGLEVWAAISGVDTVNWGGCEIWSSYDGVNYSLVGMQTGPARMGVLTAQLAAIAGTVPTVDDTHTLAIDVSESAATLDSVSSADELAGNALCYVDGEFLSYRTATLTSAGHYSLTHMLRGMYGTAAAMSGAAHAIGSDFVRADGQVFKIPFDQTRIGATVSLKFLSFNNFGQAKQGLSDVSAYTYLITGRGKGALAGGALQPGAVFETDIINNNIVVTDHLVADTATKLDVAQNGTVLLTTNGATVDLVTLTVSTPAGGSTGVIIASVDMAVIWGDQTVFSGFFDQNIRLLVDGVVVLPILAPAFAAGPTHTTSGNNFAPYRTAGHFEASYKMALAAGNHTIKVQIVCPPNPFPAPTVNYSVQTPTIISLQRFR